MHHYSESQRLIHNPTPSEMNGERRYWPESVESFASIIFENGVHVTLPFWRNPNHSEWTISREVPSSFFTMIGILHAGGFRQIRSTKLLDLQTLLWSIGASDAGVNNGWVSSLWVLPRSIIIYYYLIKFEFTEWCSSWWSQNKSIVSVGTTFHCHRCW